MTVPNSRVERNGVQFIVPSEIELEGSVVLMPGTYEGRTTHLGYIKHEETVWMPKRYFLELDTKQIADMGGRAPEHLTLVEYEVTKHVEDGLIRVE
jgi:hypothetical protein